MKKAIIILSAIALLACNQQSKSKPPQEVADETEIYQTDTLLINQQQYIRTTRGEFDEFVCLTTINGDTIIPYANYYHLAEFLDINEDGYSDIRIFVFSKTANQCDNYLFDIQDKTFHYLENCCLDIQKIKGTDYYYSYSSTGCSDMNWVSELVKIENFKTILLGYIDGQGCDYGDEPRYIEIYKVAGKGNSEKLVEQLPYSKYIPNFEDKFDFMEKYWTKNYQKFKKIISQ
jgi:hypothetical protein